MEEPTPGADDFERQTFRWARIGVLVAAVTFAIVVYQTGLLIQQTNLAKTQTELATKQTELAVKQDKIISDQLARRANLVLVVEPDQDGPESRLWRLLVKNDGTKATQEYYWHLLIPVAQRQVEL